MKKGLALLIWTMVLLFAVPPSISAHAALLDTNPSDGEVVAAAPEKLVLTFSEVLEPDRGEVLLFDWNGHQIKLPQGESGERTATITRELPMLRDGTYTVVWNVVSADGHPVEGSFSFSVGEESDETVTIPTGSDWAHIGLILSRFGVVGLLLVGAGIYWTAYFAARRGLPDFAGLLGRGRLWGGGAIVVGMILSMVCYSAVLPGPSLFALIWEGRWDLVFQSPAVVVLFIQLVLLLLLAVPDMTNGWYLGVWAVLAASPAFGGHIWGMESSWTAAAVRVGHLWTVAWWVGGLSYLLLAGWHIKRHHRSWDWSTFRPFMGRVAIGAALLAIISGLVMVVLQTDGIFAFTAGTLWSYLLWTKIVLTLLMLFLGWALSRKWSQRPAVLPRLPVRLEWVVGVGILLAGVWMSQLPYPLPERPHVQELQSEEAAVPAELHISRLHIGTQTLTFSWDTEMTGEPERVEVRLYMPEHEMKLDPIEADRTESGRYQAEIPLNMVGVWEVEVRATLSQGEEIRWMDRIFVPGGGVS
ncbi:copper resistance protein CopC [Desmospora profundinema]|uniref:Copper transport protein n=1 Tax=Desmospora profundinema TaxID=1571184 RepID=A0ABU1IPW4_9BACL|nr:copper resistance protein CopC [Desmospora profundinema]MDR6225974.1 copper transport protein [Desmospora profundinema]